MDTGPELAEVLRRLISDSEDFDAPPVCLQTQTLRALLTVTERLEEMEGRFIALAEVADEVKLLEKNLENAEVVRALEGQGEL